MNREATEILNDIANFYGLTKDREIAEKLSISATTLSNWKRRNTYDINVIVERCPDLDINNLLRGLSLNANSDKHQATPKNNNNYQSVGAISKIIEEKDRVIIQLAEKIGTLKQELKQIKAERDNLAHRTD